MGFPGGTSGKKKNSVEGVRDTGSIPGLEDPSPWRRAWQPTPVFLPRE